MITPEQIKTMERDCDAADKEVCKIKELLAAKQVEVRQRVAAIEDAYRKLRAQKELLTPRGERITM